VSLSERERSALDASEQRRLLSAGALAVLAPWPAAGPTLALLQLLLGPANTAFSGHLLLRILDPADELVAGQRRDVPKETGGSGARDERAMNAGVQFAEAAREGR
jgi:hypothetical protein